MKKIVWLILLLACQLLVAQPNVIFILADDLGYGDLGVYGNTDIKTPAIDQLANEGILFKRAYANSTVCSPSRAAILFGEYPDLIGVPGVIRDKPDNTWGNLKDGVVSLSQKFKDAGYSTALIGKWHLGYQSPDLPLNHGFDHFKGFVGDMMDDYYSHLRNGVNWMRNNDKVIESNEHATELFTKWAKEFIRNEGSDKNPFFLFVAYNAPHDPVQPPQKNLASVESRLKDLDPKRQKMIAMVEHVDQNVAQIIEVLKEKNIYDETIIVFTSDNGGALNYGASNAPFSGGKGDMLEGGIRIPCIISWPVMKESKEISEPFLLMDFYRLLPALAQLIGPSQDDVFDIVSKYHRDQMVWVRREGHKYGGLAYYAISDGKFKLLQNTPFEPFQLYQIDKDPFELVPIKDNIKEKELLRKLTEHIQESGKTPWQ